MTLKVCTLTGVDEKTDLRMVEVLSGEFPFVEWGFLYSPKRQGSPGRYPSIEFLRQALFNLPKEVRVALHICGAGVGDLLCNEEIVSGLASKIAVRGGRIQLNFNHRTTPLSVSDFKWLGERFIGADYIIQANDNNAEIVRVLAGISRVHMLFDSSGGRGIYDGLWPNRVPHTYCGYAGGLGCHERIRAQLRGIYPASNGEPFWIDMESVLRRRNGCEDGWFDLMESRKILAEVAVEMQHQDVA